MRIGVDIDGVTADFVGAVNAWIHEQWGYEPKPATSWDWFKQYPMHAAVWNTVWDIGVRRHHILLGCRPIVNAIGSIKRLAREHDVQFVTYRPEDTLTDTKRWLTCWGLGDLPLLFVEDKAVGNDLHIDDHPETVASLRDRGFKAVLFKQPWNTEHWTDLPSVSGWAELLMHFDGWHA